jgi:hypothetical protein
MYVNITSGSQLYFCRDDGVDGEWAPFTSGVWKQNVFDVSLTDISNPIDKRWGIGTSTPEFKLTLENDGGIIAKGTFGQGATLTTSGEGSRLIWYPRKAALRAGYVNDAAWDNNNIGNYSVAFGQNNEAAGAESMIGGGKDNTINAFSRISVIGGGEAHIIDLDSLNAIGGGYNNSILGGYSFIGGGDRNRIGAQNSYATLLGGMTNTVNSDWGALGGGRENIVNGYYSVIFGGKNNMITSPTSSHATLIGGSTNTIADAAPHSTIAGGSDNWIGNITDPDCGYYAADLSTIGGGFENLVTGVASTISAGKQNVIKHNYTVIGGGKQNTNTTTHAAIAGGFINQIIPDTTCPTDEAYGFIGGGSGNKNQALNSAIFGGTNNLTDGQYHVILGGSGNSAKGEYSVISGGELNSVSGSYNWAGGSHMKILADRTFLWGYQSTDLEITQSDAFLIPTADMGVGVLAPEAKMHVDGNFRIDNGTLAISSPYVIPGESPTQALERNASCGTIGYDLAETFDTSESVEPGDLVSIDQDQKGHLKKSHIPYDPKVIGFVSEAPAIILDGRQMILAPQPADIDRNRHPPIALSGRIRAKVCLENGPISPGDLLTSSSRPGFAMRATDHHQATGAIVGKAMEPFTGMSDGISTGIITVFITRQ